VRKWITVFILSLSFADVSLAITPEEKNFLEKNCQDVISLMKEGKSVEDKLTKAIIDENKQEWERLSTCISIILKKKTEAVTSGK